MGLVETLAGPLAQQLSKFSNLYLISFALATLTAAAIILNVFSQIFLKDRNKPPVVFHWVPFIGSTISYGIDPYNFFFSNKQKYGDIFTFVLLGKKTTVFLGTKGNEFILNGKLSDVNAEDIYQPLTTPVFGKDVVYDCPNAKLMEQKKFVKFGLTTEAFRTYVPIIVDEVHAFLKGKRFGNKQSGVLDIPPAMEELTLYTASHCLQGDEVRSKFDSTFAELFHDLDAGFQPINFMLPWMPLPQNRRRDHARETMANTYLEIIRSRKGEKKNSEDMIWNLMQSVYKNGTPIPDREVAHMMIALLMAGQHSSATTASFILLRCASTPQIWADLLQEQKDVLGTDEDGNIADLSYDDLSRLTLHSQVVKETLRIHAPIHSIMRNVTSPMHIEGTGWTVPAGHTLLSAPGVTSKMSEYFPEPAKWDPHRWDASNIASLPKEKEEDDDDKVDYGYGLTSKGTSSPYLPFGAGRHRCIGEQFAYLQLTTILATFVRELSVWNGEKKGDGDGVVPGTDYSSLFSRPLRPATLKWERREKIVE